MSAVLQLPGGLVTDRDVHRMAHVRAPTGIVERAVAACSVSSRILPRVVSAVIAAAVERIGDVSVTPDVAARLTIGDRMFLMLRLAIRYVGDLVWLSPNCETCGRPFDVPVKRSQLIVRSPSGDYPNCILHTGEHEVELRPPCGLDQYSIAETQPDDAELALIASCTRLVDGGEPKPAFFEGLSTGQRGEIGAAMEAASPVVECSVSVQCPECGGVQSIEIEPYWFGDPQDNSLDAEVHALAYHYHWNEADILNLPVHLRRRYCSLINKERNLHV